MDEKVIRALEFFPLVFTILNLVIWTIGVLQSYNNPNPHITGFIEQTFLKSDVKQAIKRFTYPIFQTVTLYTIGMGMFLIAPLFFYTKGMVDGCYFRLTMQGKFSKEFLFIYLIVLIPSVAGLYYGTRIFIALILDLIDVSDQQVEIKRSVYSFLIALMMAIIIGIILSLIAI